MATRKKKNLSANQVKELIDDLLEGHTVALNGEVLPAKGARARVAQKSLCRKGNCVGMIGREPRKANVHEVFSVPAHKRKAIQGVLQSMTERS